MPNGGWLRCDDATILHVTKLTALYASTNCTSTIRWTFFSRTQHNLGWSRTSVHIRYVDKLSAFKRQVKSYFFPSAFAVCALALDSFLRFLALLGVCNTFISTRLLVKLRSGHSLSNVNEVRMRIRSLPSLLCIKTALLLLSWFTKLLYITDAIIRYRAAAMCAWLCCKSRLSSISLAVSPITATVIMRHRHAADLASCTRSLRHAHVY